MEGKNLRLELLTSTRNAELLVSTAAKLCYYDGDSHDLMEEIKRTDNTGFISKLMSMGHLSPLEHISFTFLIEGVSRALLAQITRHRLASFSVRSQRYVNSLEGFDYIIPPSIEGLGEDAVNKFKGQMDTLADWYREWLSLLGEGLYEDARFILPNAAETKMIVTMNARELLHFVSLRSCNRAQWEIRELSDRMLYLARMWLS